MPTTSRGKSLSVIDRLKKNPKSFSFSQAVRMLERASSFSNKDEKDHSPQKTNFQRPAIFGPPSREAIRFTHNHELGFPDSEIEYIRPLNKENKNKQWLMGTNFLGLTGSIGVMPYHYTERTLKQIRKKDTAMSSFLNLFMHRSISLFYQASNKYRLPIEYERTKLHNPSEQSNHTKALLGLLGLGTAHLNDRQTLTDESLIFYSGLFSQQAKTASGLEQILQDYFDVPIKIESFIGQWQELIDDVRSRLPTRNNPQGQNVCLGRSVMLGKKGWYAQGKSRIKIGPLNEEQYHRFAPGTGTLKALNELVMNYAGMEQDFEFLIDVKREAVPNKIALKKQDPPMLAWNTWLSGKPKTNTHKDSVLEISVSQKKIS